ncbi:VUT family protein [Risungbinella massiliensis]|uniref:VUT family protein n=1 Tax=Risungbinella massiliensis TaxID=1329796 RepID=UPI0005CB8759|nr:VUT family protein [Risungbinella massiliensis]
MRILFYILAILIANVVTAAMKPLEMGIFLIPAGTFFIGFTFILRDFVQNQIGRQKTYVVILSALILSAITSYLLGDTIWVVFASALSFALSETADTEIYSRLRLPLSYRVLYSGLVGGILDSVIFVIIGISPLGAGFIPWEAVPAAISGQILVKCIMQLLGAFAVHRIVASKI